jgi:Tfp pilus tip-associated adhesin PilY1
MKITNTLAKLMLLSVSMVFSQQGVAQTAIPCTVPECQPLGYIGPMELSTTNLTYGARGYRGWFENGGWQGDLIEYTITAAGGLSTTIDLSGPSPVQPDGSVNWSAHAEFWDTRNSSSHWNTGRQIIFSNSYGFSQEAFRWNELDDYQKGVLDNLTSVTATAGTASAVLNYLRGDRLNEGAAGSMRTR